MYVYGVQTVMIHLGVRGKMKAELFAAAANRRDFNLTACEKHVFLFKTRTSVSRTPVRTEELAQTESIPTPALVLSSFWEPTVKVGFAKPLCLHSGRFLLFLMKTLRFWFCLDA